MLSRGASDSGLSSDSGETYEGFREVAHNLEASLNFCIRDRIRYVEQQMNNIRAAKAAFSKKFHDMNKLIESMIGAICTCALAREQNLKSQLKEIGNIKILEWNQQLKICREAEEALKGFRHVTMSALQTTCNTYARSIGFIDAGDVKFDGALAPVLRQLDLFADDLFGRDSIGRVLENVEPKFTIGKLGKNIGEFKRPWGVCSDATGRIYVADRGNNRVQVFNECGVFLLQFGKSGSDPGEFNRPSGITVDGKNRIIVSDKDNHRVQIFTLNGHFEFCFGRKGTNPGLFQYPWDVAVDGNSNIAVSDTRNHRVQLFDWHGSFLTMFDFNGIVQGLSKKVSPRGVVFKPDGTLMVTDFNNGCIFLVDRSFKNFAKWESEIGHVHRPQGLACDDSGAVAVVDSSRNLVQVFDELGNLTKFFGKKGSNPGEFDCLQDICFQPDGSIVVTEFRNNRVQVL